MIFGTISNTLTALRILLLPLFIACFWLEGSNAAMIQALFFVLLGLTDFADGWLARYLQQESHFGAVMDPIADKLLVIITLIMLLSNDTISGIHTLAVILIISREIIISGLREALVQVNSNKLAVSVLAKWKTTLQFSTLALLLFSPSPIYPEGSIFALAPMYFLWITAALTIKTGFDYSLITYRTFRKKPEITPAL